MNDVVDAHPAAPPINPRVPRTSLRKIPNVERLSLRVFVAPAQAESTACP
jgi:hypothetical protein